MEKSARQIARNAAKVEFMIHVEDILMLLSGGYNKLNIYSILRDKKNIAMSYRAFCHNLQQHQKTKEETKAAPLSMPSAIPATVPSKDKFLKPEDVDVKSLF